MKLVREHINEKFTDDSDPITDMGIGIFHSHDFKSIEDFINFLIINFKVITGYDLDPKILFHKREEGFGVIYNPIYQILMQKIRKYKWTLKGIGSRDRWPSLSGWYNWPEKFKETVLKDINEKFSEDSDPIEDMGIGIFHPHDFKTDDEWNKFLHDNFKAITGKDFDPKIIFNIDNCIIWSPIFNIIEEKAKQYIWTINGINIINIHYWPRSFDTYVEDPKILEDPKIFEKFSDESDPIIDMGIGIPDLFKRDIDIMGPKPPKINANKYFGNTEFEWEFMLMFSILFNCINSNDFSIKRMKNQFTRENIITVKGMVGENRTIFNNDKFIEIFKERYGIDLS